MRDPDSPSGPDPTADAFDAIVAGWRREGRVPVWPDEAAPAPLPDPLPGPSPGPLPDPARGVPQRPDARPGDRYDPPADDHADDHFVPPEPPPLPRLGPPAAVGLGLLVVGLLLIVWPGLLGIPELYGLPLGLLALACGLGWLVLRLWPAPPPRGDGDGEDDGAVL